MNAILIGAALLCGVPLGFIVGLIAGARMYRGVTRNEFDGGFSDENPPPRAVTRIWFPEERK